jgi:ribosomal protein S18 acetylase RimI-like enzyme
VHSWQAAYRGRIADTYLQGLSVEQQVRDWEKVFQADASFTLLAQEKDDQTIVGFITLGSYRDGDAPQDGLLELRALYIDPDHWRMGLGKKLTRLAMEECRQRKVGRLVLWVLESNSEARFWSVEAGDDPLVLGLIWPYKSSTWPTRRLDSYDLGTGPAKPDEHVLLA